ncbi:MAG: hypothetical protein NTX22_14740 [Ignavibacteriales bacterium]|nr:hypothetical protein [Ignavibacteriales bacterium]
MENCNNHPQNKSVSICHSCGKFYCELCMDEGKEFYYCKKPECQEKLKNELAAELLPVEIICPNCSNSLELSDDERNSRKFHCPECESFLDFEFDPPKIIKPKDYSHFLLSSLNQGDVAVIKSILDDAKIDYFVYGENFLSTSPLIQPARFYVLESRVEEAKELLKDFELHIFGASNRKENE